MKMLKTVCFASIIFKVSQFHFETSVEEKRSFGKRRGFPS